jgi:hypothetical protein
MKKLFTAAPMTKLLIATSILAMSSTAIAAVDQDRNDASSTDDALIVNATFVETLAVTLTETAIDFGEVYQDAPIDDVEVFADVFGDKEQGFDFKIETSGAIVTLDGNNDPLQGSLNLESGNKQISFLVNLDSSLVTDAFSQETITTTVNYTGIEGTTSGIPIE